MCSAGGQWGTNPTGLLHSEIPGSKCACHSPRLIAACHVLRRLMVPRHPSCARIRLAEGLPPEGLKPSRSVYVAFPRKRSIVKDQYIAHGPLFGGGSRIRTGDIQLAKLTLCQLSYAPINCPAFAALGPEGMRQTACAASPCHYVSIGRLLRKEVIQPLERR